jgi:hypothetical protein
VSDVSGDAVRLVDLTDPAHPRIGDPLPGGHRWAAVGPGDTTFAAGSTELDQKGVRMWRPGGAPVALDAPPGWQAAVPGPDGRTLAIYDRDGAQVWRYSPSGDSYRVGTLQAGTVPAAMAFGSDGLFAVLDQTGFLTLWRIGSGEHQIDPVAAVPTGLRDVRALQFAAGGAVYAATGSGLSVWPTDASAIRFRACEFGHLQQREWDNYFPGFDYRSPCG